MGIDLNSQWEKISLNDCASISWIVNSNKTPRLTQKQDDLQREQQHCVTSHTLLSVHRIIDCALYTSTGNQPKFIWEVTYSLVPGLSRLDLAEVARKCPVPKGCGQSHVIKFRHYHNMLTYHGTASV